MILIFWKQNGQEKMTSEILNWNHNFVFEISLKKGNEEQGYSVALYLKCNKCGKDFNYIERVTLKKRQSPAQKINEYKKMAETFARALSESYASIKCSCS